MYGPPFAPFELDDQAALIALEAPAVIRPELAFVAVELRLDPNGLFERLEAFRTNRIGDIFRLDLFFRFVHLQHLDSPVVQIKYPRIIIVVYRPD